MAAGNCYAGRVVPRILGHEPSFESVSEYRLFELQKQIGYCGNDLD